MDENCKLCCGTGWVCVDHPDQPAFECELCDPNDQAEGMACECNPDADKPPGFQTIASVEPRYVLRSQTADGAPLWFDGGGPTTLRSSAAEYDAAEAEHARAHFAYVFGIEVEAVEVETRPDA